MIRTIAVQGLLVSSVFHASSADGAGADVPTSDDFLVVGLEEIEPAYASFEGNMYAGLLPVEEYQAGTNVTNAKKTKDTGEYMFWLFQPDTTEVEDALTIWFNGGPGCSSFHAGLLMENGPVTTKLHPAGFFAPPQENNAPFIANEYTWTRVSSMLYVEQPFPVGFSHGGVETKNETDVGRYFYGFLQNFMRVFPDMENKRIFLVGESYAGMYCPSVAHYIHKQNKVIKKSGTSGDSSSVHLNLAGIALGNGWIDATIQGPLVIDYAFWHGMIDSVTKEALYSEWEHCKKHILDSSTTSDTEPPPFHGFTVPDECGIMSAVLDASGAGLLHRGSPNTYDVTTWDPYDLLNSNDNSHIKFFNNPEVQAKLHVHPQGRVWMGCIPGAGRRRLSEETEKHLLLTASHRRRLLLLDNDRPISAAPYIAGLLDDAEIDVLVYNGDRDMSTCLQGSEKVLNEMEWSGQSDWMNPDNYMRGLWLVDGEMSGYAKQVKKLQSSLQLLMVYNSGHLVPFNRPRQALDLIRRVVRGESFADRQIPVIFKQSLADAPKPKTGWSEETSREETIILVFIAFAFGYAFSVLLSHLHLRYFGKDKDGYERVPDGRHRSHHGSQHGSQHDGPRIPTVRSRSSMGSL